MAREDQQASNSSQTFSQTGRALGYGQAVQLSGPTGGWAAAKSWESGRRVRRHLPSEALVCCDAEDKEWEVRRGIHSVAEPHRAEERLGGAMDAAQEDG